MVSKVVNDGVINWNKLYISGGVRGEESSDIKKYYDGHHSVDYNVCERWYKFIKEKVVLSNLYCKKIFFQLAFSETFF